MDLTALSAAQAADAVAAGDLDAAELFEAYRARAAADELNAWVHVVDEPPAPADGALRADVPHVSLDREVALGQAPATADDGFLVPSPQA